MHASAVVQDKIYLIGGSVIGGRNDVFSPTPDMYNFDPDFAYATSVNISARYLVPQGNNFIVNAQLNNPDYHSASVCSYIHGTGSAFQDSIQLFDDGLHNDGADDDNYYGGVKWLSGLDEDFYNVELKTTDLTNGNIHFYSLNEHFTTAGPLEVDSIVSGAISNNRYTIKPYIRNYGTQIQIENIIIKLLCNDSWVTAIYPSFKTSPDISPGETKTVTSAFAVTYDSASFPGYFNLRFEILSNDILYWTDSVNTAVTGIDDDGPAPASISLSQNYPNPFNPVTIISYQLTFRTDVTLIVYDILGREIATLVNEYKSSGKYKVDFNAAKLPCGVYFYQLKAGEFIETRKMIFLK